MKRLSILLSLMLVLALSAGAAAQFTLSGFVQMDATLRQKKVDTDDNGLPVYDGWEFYGQSRQHVRLTLGTRTSQSGTLKLVLGFGNNDQGSTSANTWYSWASDGNNPAAKAVNLDLNSARIEATGPLWKEGQSLTTVLGRFTPNYSPWVASSSAKNPTKNETQNMGYNGVEIRTLQLGPLGVRAYYGIAYNNGDFGQDRVFAVDVAGKLAGVDAQVTAVNREVVEKNAAERERVWDIAAVLSTKPVDGVELSGVVVVDGQGQGTAGDVLPDVKPKLGMKAEVKVTTIPNVTLTGSAYKYDLGFAPRYAQWAKGSGGYYTQFTTNRQGYKVGAETTQAGVTFDGSYANETDADGTAYEKQVIEAGAKTTIEGFDLSARVTLTEETGKANATETTFSIGKAISNVNLKYTGTLLNEEGADKTKAKHQISADTTVNLFFADNVKLSATVIHNSITDPSKGSNKDKDENIILDKDGNVIPLYGIDASWKAPNGIDIVVGYANYNKSGNNFVHEKEPDGFYIRATTQVNF